jgi:hypothetical protein
VRAAGMDVEKIQAMRTGRIRKINLQGKYPFLTAGKYWYYAGLFISFLG